jgi:hypothetical protein
MPDEVRAAAERLLAEVANHRFLMRLAHDPDKAFTDDIETVARAVLERYRQPDDAQEGGGRDAVIERDYPPATDETICKTCGERGHYWCRPSRIIFTGRGVPYIHPDDFAEEDE